ncbi:MAG: FG-GAP-like repeat-containing protein, partial [Oceanipulchritudo sp.]
MIQKSFLILLAATLLPCLAARCSSTILVNFGSTGYANDGFNTWQSFDIRAGGVDNSGLASISGAGLVDSAGNATGIGFTLGTNGSPELFLNNPADADVTESFDWFDDTVAEQRQGYGFGPAGRDITYTFSGFNPAHSVTFAFLLARVGSGGSGSRIVDVTSSFGGLLYDDADTNQGGLMVTETVTGAGSYTYTLTANASAGYPGSINALQITLPDPEPGVTAFVSSPGNGATVYANDPLTVEVVATAVGTTVDRVELSVNGMPFGSDDTDPYTFDLGYVAEGVIELSATAFGVDGSEKTATAVATVASPMARAWTRHSIDSGLNGADGARTADVDGDGDQDLIVAYEEAATVRIYENPGPATAINGNWSHVSFSGSGLASIEDANLADLDGDGRIDFVASMEGTNRKLTVYWAPAAPADYWNNANWTAMEIPSAAGQDWMYSQVLDLDGLNGPDIVAGSKGNVAGSDPATVSWLKAPADPRVAGDWIRYTMTSAGWIMSVEPQDMDGDGDADIVISDRRSG